MWPFARFFKTFNPLSRCENSRLIKMSQAWKTYCVLLLCVSTLKMLAADNTSQEEKDEKHAKKIGEKVTKAME